MTQFQHGLFGCFDNCCICIVTWFFPCYTAGKVAEKVGHSCILHGCFIFVPILNLICLTKVRGEVREQSNIEGSCFMDFLTIWCCGGCALCQEAQEVGAFGNGMAVEGTPIDEYIDRE